MAMASWNSKFGEPGSGDGTMGLSRGVERMGISAGDRASGESHGDSSFKNTALPALYTRPENLVDKKGNPWPPDHVFPRSEVSSYLGGMNTIDYFTSRDQQVWEPLPSTIAQTPPTRLGRRVASSEKSSGSSSSGLSVSRLNDWMANLTPNDSPSRPGPNYQRRQIGNEVNTQPDWSTMYQLRDSGPPALTAYPGWALSQQLARPSSALYTSPCDYTALLLAATNYYRGAPAGYVVGGCQLGQDEKQDSIERAARVYRKAATMCDATYTWSGQLPANPIISTLQDQLYSCKVFVGGVPWDITEPSLVAAFGSFGCVRVEWPGKEARYAKSPVKPSAKKRGYVYMIYETGRSVKALLENCVRDYTRGGEYYFQLTSSCPRSNEFRRVQIIPWAISDNSHIRNSSQRLDPKKTIFVGALHGVITAEVLSNVMNDLFGGVVYAGIDTDKYKYPIGSGHVTFNNFSSYKKAIAAAFVEIKSAKFSKKVQIDPYLEDAPCSNCLSVPGPYFCREFMCFRYFCKTCWHTQHALDIMQTHKPLMRSLAYRQ